MRTRLIDVLLVVYFAEVGLVLVVAPWTTYWDRNYFVEALPVLQPLLTSYARTRRDSGRGCGQSGRRAVRAARFHPGRAAAPRRASRVRLAAGRRRAPFPPPVTPRRRITDNAGGAGGRRFPAARPVLCLVTDRARLRSGGVEDDVGATLALIRSAAAAGIDLVQIRETGLTDRALGNLVERAVEAVRGTHTRILVNDRVDIALAHGADGVHLKGDSVPAARVREHAGADWIVGRSIHGLEEGREVSAGGALDYVCLGTVFATASKPGRRPLGAGLVAAGCGGAAAAGAGHRGRHARTRDRDRRDRRRRRGGHRHVRRSWPCSRSHNSARPSPR